VSYYLDGGLNMTALRMTGNDMPSPEAIANFNVQGQQLRCLVWKNVERRGYRADKIRHQQVSRFYV